MSGGGGGYVITGRFSGVRRTLHGLWAKLASIGH
jgi:hypothetical protein